MATARQVGYDLGAFQRLAGTQGPEYYARLARGYCAGCGQPLPVGVSEHCDAACKARERERNKRLFGRKPVPGERRRGLETEASCN